MNILGINIVGSHAWNMNNENSDLDLFIVGVENTSNILKGIGNTRKSKSYTIGKIDIIIHEVEKVVNQLIDGNINYIVGVLSPLNIYTNKYFDELVEITRNNLGKNCYYSINGWTRGNYDRYLSQNPNDEKRKKLIMRTLNFGINILNGDGAVFDKVDDVSLDDIKRGFSELEEAYKNSKLPEKPNEDVFREWLYKLRKDLL